ncbi:hypothetical protein ACFE04_018815 [Oxalis oulophora]
MVGTRLFNTFIFLPLLLLLLNHHENCQGAAEVAAGSFAQTTGTHFVMNNKQMYLNGFNAYWMMLYGSDESTRDKVSTTFQQASKYGMNIARTWAFNDGDYKPLQSSPGSYNEDVFKYNYVPHMVPGVGYVFGRCVALDFVISEAKRNGVFLILSFVNNFNDFGGKAKYVKWAQERGQNNLNNEDDFYSNPLTKEFYKNHIKTVLTRNNSITGVVYKDDPTIFAWELMNEPRCQTDPSGQNLQNWIREMAMYVKSIDKSHLLEIGLEGFYGDSIPDRKMYNPNAAYTGADFILNNQVSEIDFATIHMYPESWLPSNMNSSEQQVAFVDKWMQAHIQDCNYLLKKPLLIGEFGKSSRLSGYSLEKRDDYYRRVYDAIYTSASNGGSFSGGIFWQLMAKGMDNMGDGYEVILEDSPSTASVITQQSHKLLSLP